MALFVLLFKKVIYFQKCNRGVVVVPKKEKIQEEEYKRRQNATHIFFKGTNWDGQYDIVNAYLTQH